jgi:hypothetical protein
VDLFGSECEGTVTDRGACSWEIEAECLVPDFSSSAHGTFEATTEGITGRFELTSTSGWTGEACHYVVAWSRAP